MRFYHDYTKIKTWCPNTVIQESRMCKDFHIVWKWMKPKDAGNSRKNTFHVLKHKIVICGVKYMWCKTNDKVIYVTQVFFILTYSICPLYSTHYFLSTAPMSGVLFALQLIKAQKIRLGVCLQSAGSQRMVSVVVPPHWELHKLTASLGRELQRCWISSDRACNQTAYMRCVWDKLLDSFPSDT